MTDLDFNVLAKKTFRARCEHPLRWDHESEKYHQISYQESSKWQSQKDLCNELNDFYGQFTKYPMLSVYHARKMMGRPGFDMEIAQATFDTYSNIFNMRKFMLENLNESTVHLAMEKGFKQRRLNQLCDVFGIKLDHHNSESDTNACFELYKIFKTKDELDVFAKN